MKDFYSRIIVDTSNIFYRINAIYKVSVKDPKPLLDGYIKWINGLEKNTNDICLLFDPIASKYNKEEIQNNRKRMNADYKANRDNDSEVAILRATCLERLFDYYVLEENRLNGKIRVFHNPEFEADDYAEKLSEKGDVLFCTSDKDYCRFMEKGPLLYKGLALNKRDNIMEVEDYIYRHKYVPTPSTVTLMKALYGDKSDNITGAFKTKEIVVFKEVSDAFKRAIAEHPMVSLDDSSYYLFNGLEHFEEPMALLERTLGKRKKEQLLALLSTNLDLIRTNPDCIPENCMVQSVFVNKSTKPKILMNN